MEFCNTFLPIFEVDGICLYLYLMKLLWSLQCDKSIEHSGRLHELFLHSEGVKVGLKIRSNVACDVTVLDSTEFMINFAILATIFVIPVTNLRSGSICWCWYQRFGETYLLLDLRTRAKCHVVIIVFKVCKMADEDEVKPRNFHEMELDDRILKVSWYLVWKLFNIIY